MSRTTLALRATALAAVLVLAACQDGMAPLSPDEMGSPHLSSSLTGQEARALHARAIPEVLALPQTVFGGLDQETNQLVFGVEHAGVMNGVRAVMSRLGAPAASYRVEVTEPIHFASTTLRTEHRPTKGGIQINFGNFVCTLGFSVDHAGGRSFITNSHCTDQQGSTGSTAYFQPSSTTSPSAIAIEAHDPAYSKNLPGCSRGKNCRYSDAARALYAEGVASNGEIAKTDGVNSGSLTTVDGSFNITGQDNTTTSFAIGMTVQKVGRTTGWTSGEVTNTCATVNVSGTNIQLLCQTLVQNTNAVIVQGGDSGSPVFTGISNVNLIGILWGGNTSGSLFVFSPLKGIQDELGSMDATTNGVGGGGSNGGGGEPEPCVPNRAGRGC
jgi:hypothetical protein